MTLVTVATRTSFRRNSATPYPSSHPSLYPLRPQQKTATPSHYNFQNRHTSSHVFCRSSGLFHTVPLVTKRFRSTIFFSDEKGSAEENVYFKKEDEVLLKNLLSNHPEFNPKYSTALLEEEVGSLARDLHLVCRKHGVSNISLAFIRDIQTVFEMHGWKKTAPLAGQKDSSVTRGREQSFLRASKSSTSFSPL